MDSSKASIVICLTIVAVIAVNLLIYYALRRGINIREIDIMRQITDRSKAPWKKEQQDLDELAKLVEDLKRPADHSEDKKNS